MAGIQKERGYIIGSATVQEVIADHGKARKQFKRSRLRWRVSGGVAVLWAGFRLNPEPLNGKAGALSSPDIISKSGIDTAWRVSFIFIQ